MLVKIVMGAIVLLLKEPTADGTLVVKSLVSDLVRVLDGITRIMVVVVMKVTEPEVMI